MIRDDVSTSAERCVQRRDVRVSDECLWVAAYRVEVHDPAGTRGAVAAAQTPDAIDALVAQRVVEVARALGVVSREVTGSRKRMLADDRLPSQRLRLRARNLQLACIAQWAGWRDQRDAGAAVERWWKSHGFAT